MSNLSIRKLDTFVYNQLRIRAARNGVSMEEEARRIIYQAVCAPEKISDVFQKYFGALGLNLSTQIQNSSSQDNKPISAEVSVKDPLDFSS